MKKEKKINLRFIMLMICAFLTILVGLLLGLKINSLEVNAYHIDNDGNMVSDNLLDVESFYWVPNGVNGTIDDGRIILSGSSSDSGGISTMPRFQFTPGTYTLKIFNQTGTFNASLYFWDYTNNRSYFGVPLNSLNNYEILTVNASSSDQCGLSIYYNAGNSINLSFNVMLVKSSSVPTSYEPFGEIYYSSDNYQLSYNQGYLDGINTYEPTNDNPTFNIRSYSYVNTNGDTASATLNDNNNNVSVIDFSNYAAYSSYSINDNLYLESYSTEIILNQSYSANSTFYLPVIESGHGNFRIKFCDGFQTYQYFGYTYTYCKSIAKNFDDTLTGNYYGLYSDYYNNGISYYELINNTPIENNFYILDLGEYLVSDASTFNVLLIQYNGSTEAFYNAVSLGFATTTINEESYSMGYKDGFNIGNSVGLNTRNQIEYNAGYNAGILYASSNNDNTLVGMVGAVATTPVNLLTSIFNFEFLGINIAGFILSIITLLVVIWLIKRFI